MIPQIGSNWRNIVVSGPQRSGTRIISRIIAHETGYDYVDEEEFTAVSVAGWNAIIADSNRKVIHCPAMSPYIHTVPDDVLVVMCIRNTADCEASEKRIDWDGRGVALSHYGLPAYEWLTVSAIKYMCWEKVQRPQLTGRFLEVRYPEDIADHELYVPKEQRTDFDWNQTELGEIDERGHGSRKT